MKRLVWVVVAIAVTLIARVSGAEQLEIRVAKDGTVVSRLTGASSKPDCAVAPYGDPKPLSFVKEGDGSWTAIGDNAFYVSARLDGTPLPTVLCRASAGADLVHVPTTVSVETPLQLPMRVDPSSGVDLPPWLVEKLGKLTECKAGSGACTLEGTRLKPSSLVESGTLVASFTGQRKTEVRAKVETCRFALDSPAGLVRGARLGAVEFRPLVSGCWLSSRDAGFRLTRAGLADIPVTDAGNSGFFSFRLPAEAPVGVVDFVIEVAGQKGGTATGRIIAAPDRKTEDLRVTYADPSLDRLQDPLSAKGVAVALPEGVSDKEGPVIRNAAHITIPPELASAVDEVAGVPTTDTRPMFWQIVQTTWGPDVNFSCLDGKLGEPSTSQFRATTATGEACRLKDLSTIEFAVTRRKLEPLDAVLQLRRAAKEAPREDKADAKKAIPTELVMEMTLRLANSSQVESIPFPAARFLTVECGCKDRKCDTYVKAGQTRSIDHSALQESGCRAHLDLDEANKRIKGAAIYGPQTLMVSVTPEGGATRSERWDLALNAQPEDFTLPAPATQASGGEYYDVEIKVAAKQAAQVQYRAGTTQIAEVGETTDVRRGELVFDARLRSRGLYGINGALRTFVTVPVEVAAVRFPARGDELRDSSSSPNYQFMAPVVGALFGIEPWNYDTGRNRWAIPMRALAGIHAREARSHVEMAAVLGIAATLPLIDAPSELGSSLAVGTYASVDLAPSKRRFDDRMAFVATFGFNVLSLFAGR